MTAAPVFLPPVSSAIDSTASRPQTAVHAVNASASWQLTDRGIAVVMAIAGVIIAVALVVIGLTAMRVTSAEYDSGTPVPSQPQS